MLGFFLWASLTLGLQEGGVYINTSQYEFPPYLIGIEAHAESTWLDLYGGYRTHMEHWASFGFNPLFEEYTIGATVSYKAISLNVEHQCAHPVDAYGTNDNPQFDSWHNRIEITIRSTP